MNADDIGCEYEKKGSGAYIRQRKQKLNRIIIEFPVFTLPQVERAECRVNLERDSKPRCPPGPHPASRKGYVHQRARRVREGGREHRGTPATDPVGSQVHRLERRFAAVATETATAFTKPGAQQLGLGERGQKFPAAGGGRTAEMAKSGGTNTAVRKVNLPQTAAGKVRVCEEYIMKKKIYIYFFSELGTKANKKKK